MHANDNTVMGLNLDKEGEYTPWGIEPTPKEVAEAEAAQYVIRAIGDTTMAGYTDDKERAYGKAANIALHSMQEHGAQVELRDIPTRIVEFRINKENRGLVTIQWVTVEDQPSGVANDPTLQG